MTVDLTGIATSLVALATTALGVVLQQWLSHLKNQTAAAVIDKAVGNSLGAIAQAAESTIRTLPVGIPGVPAALAPGVQYVLDQAGPELGRLGITPVAVAAKIDARLGLTKIKQS